MKLTKIESYEIQAFAFRVMTGYTAPGKDVSPLAYQAPYEERCAAFDEWRNEHAHCILAMLHGFEALIDRDDEPTRALLDRLDAAEREIERLRKFAGKVLDKSREEFLEMSCGDIEDWAKQFGLLEPVTMTAACGDDCKCAELADFPLECPRPTALGSAAIDAARAAERGKE